MASSYEYILNLTDKVSGKLQKITGSSVSAVDKFIKLQDKTKALQRSTKDFGNSITTLRQKIDLLQQERDLINPKNLTTIRKYNSEIKGLSKEINKLETVNGSKFKKGVKDAFNELPGIFTNPVAMGAAAMGFAGKSAMDFDQSMAKVNVTAQLDDKGLSDLRAKLTKIALDNKAEISVAPDGFEKILSQVGDVNASLKIFDTALKGAKAGTTNLDVVSGALAQTMSILGSEKANAQEVMDTFFAAKRVGAGEFEDFARYMPGLIAGADNLGVKYKEVAGVFAYMTGKGQSAERASVLMENAFSALGKSDIQKNLASAGVKIFDDAGKMRGMGNIIQDLSTKLSGFTDKERGNFLEKMGLRDKEAKSAFSILTSDVSKLNDTLAATANATGETDRALTLSRNSMQKLTEVWNTFKNIGTIVGAVVLPVIGAGLGILQPILYGVLSVITAVKDSFSWFFTLMKEGNPLALGLGASIASLVAIMTAQYIISQKAIISTKAKAMWDGIVAVSTKVWAGAQWMLNTALYGCPIIWIVLAIGALVAAIVICVTKVQGWGKQWDSIMKFMKFSFLAYVETFKLQWTIAVNGFMIGINKIKEGWYQFKEAVGLGDSSVNQAALAKIQKDTAERKKAIIDGAAKVSDYLLKAKDSLKWELSWKENEKSQAKEKVEGGSEGKQSLIDKVVPKIPTIAIPSSGEQGKTINLNDSNIKGSTSYGAIASKLSSLRFRGLNDKTSAPKKLKEVTTLNETTKGQNYKSKKANKLNDSNIKDSSLGGVIASKLSFLQLRGLKTETSAPKKLKAATALNEKATKGQNYKNEKANKLNDSNIKDSSLGGAIASKLSFLQLGGLNAETSAPKKLKTATVLNENAKKGQNYKNEKANCLKLISDNVVKIAASIALVSLMATSGVAANEISTSGTSTSLEGNMPKRNKARQVHFEKFCEQIVINIPDGVKDHDELVERIKKEIIEEFNHAFDSYD